MNRKFKDCNSIRLLWLNEFINAMHLPTVRSGQTVEITYQGMAEDPQTGKAVMPGAVAAI